MQLTLFDKIWNRHIVRQAEDGWSLLYIDRHLLHDLSGTAGLNELSRRRIQVHRPELTFATPDHSITTAPKRSDLPGSFGEKLRDKLKSQTEQAGITLFDLGTEGQGIVHVIGPEQGLTLPGLTLVCGDSHTCTHGGLGALAFGIGSSECSHVLATQTLWQRKPKQMRVSLSGTLGPGITAKDLALYVIGRLGTKAASGFAVEYCGSTVEAMDVESRLTLCNMTIELGGKYGLIAPDEKVFTYIRGRKFAPQGENFSAAVSRWRSLFSDPDAEFDSEVHFHVSDVGPMMSWGTSPEQVISINKTIPEICSTTAQSGTTAAVAALKYMGLEAGSSLAGISVDWVFIGSCTNGRLSDLREAAAIIRGRRVAKGVTAWIVPGSESVSRQAELEGLRQDFETAGFHWREPGCSLCVAANGERVPEGARCVSTSNRNFEGRQGAGARTHLASPAMAAAAAIRGYICDARAF